MKPEPALLSVSPEDIPEACKIKHVPLLEAGGSVKEVLTPASEYCWVVRVGETRHFVNGDYHLPCIGTNADDTYATLEKVHPVTGECKYGPARVSRGQYDAWAAAGAVPAAPAPVVVKSKGKVA